MSVKCEGLVFTLLSHFLESIMDYIFKKQFKQERRIIFEGHKEKCHKTPKIKLLNANM